MNDHSNHSNDSWNRRTLLSQAAGAVGAVALWNGTSAKAAENAPQQSAGGVTHGRIKQSVCQWCFSDYWKVEETARVCKSLGVQSVELIDRKHWPMLKELGLTCAIASVSGGGFVKGHNDPQNWERVQSATKDSIEVCAEHGMPSVIAFTGMAGDIPADVGLENCVKSLKAVAGHAEEKGVTICLEMLNSRDDSHPMKGHPGYQGDHIDYCLEICKQVGSPRVKLLFDIYHVQIMDGDIIRRLDECRDYLGHIHTAGNPGRGELDENQEINYPAVMRKLVDLGYDGYVGQEFIPTRDPLASLRQAVEVCDV